MENESLAVWIENEYILTVCCSADAVVLILVTVIIEAEVVRAILSGPLKPCLARGNVGRERRFVVVCIARVSDGFITAGKKGSENLQRMPLTVSLDALPSKASLMIMG